MPAGPRLSSSSDWCVALSGGLLVLSLFSGSTRPQAGYIADQSIRLLGRFAPGGTWHLSGPIN